MAISIHSAVPGATGSGRLASLVVCSIPATAACGVGLTRYLDNWHHSSDVLVGLALGFSVALVVHQQVAAGLGGQVPLQFESLLRGNWGEVKVRACCGRSRQLGEVKVRSRGRLKGPSR